MEKPRDNAPSTVVHEINLLPRFPASLLNSLPQHSQASAPAKPQQPQQQDESCANPSTHLYCFSHSVNNKSPPCISTHANSLPTGKYVDITELLNVPQSEAAKALGIPYVFFCLRALTLFISFISMPFSMAKS